MTQFTLERTHLPMASTTAPANAAGIPSLANGPSVSFLATLGSEWSKFVTLRSMWINVILSLVLSVTMTGLISWATAWSYEDWGQSDQVSFDPIMFSVSGTIVAAIVFVVMNVQLVASEYSSGMIRQTMTTTPKRSRVFWAKLLVNAAVVTVLTAIVGVANFLVAQWVFAIYDAPTASLSDGDTQRLLLGMTLTAPVYPIIATVAAFLLRSAAGAITLVLGLIFVPSMFGGLLPRRYQEDVLAYLPPSLADSISLHHLDPDNQLYADPSVAWIALVAWMVVLCAVGLWFLKRRDV